MLRRVFAIASLCLLLLCVATVTVWVSTYFGSWDYSRGIARETEAEYRPIYIIARTSRGEIEILLFQFHVPLKNLNADQQQEVTRARRGFATVNRKLRWSMPYDRKPQRPTLLAREGFEFERGTFSRGVIRASSVGLSTPFWFLTLVLLLTPAAWWIIRTRRLLRAGPEGGEHVELRPDLGVILGKHAIVVGRFLAIASLISMVLCIMTIVVMRITDTTGRQAMLTSPGGTFFMARLQHGEVSFTTVGDWPQRERLRSISIGPDWSREMYPFRGGFTRVSSFSFLGFMHQKGTVLFELETDHSVMLLPYGRDWYHNGGLTHGLPARRVQFSLRELALILTILPAYWIISRIRRRIRRQVLLNQGMCSNCGYNLRGNTSGICPECGAIIALKAIAKFTANG